MATQTNPMGGNGRDFNKKYLLGQVGRQCASVIAVQKYGNNNNGGANNNGFGNRFGNGGGGNNNRFRNNSK